MPTDPRYLNPICIWCGRRTVSAREHWDKDLFLCDACGGSSRFIPHWDLTGITGAQSISQGARTVAKFLGGRIHFAH